MTNKYVLKLTTLTTAGLSESHQFIRRFQFLWAGPRGQTRFGITAKHKNGSKTKHSKEEEEEEEEEDSRP